MQTVATAKVRSYSNKCLICICVVGVAVLVVVVVFFFLPDGLCLFACF